MRAREVTALVTCLAFSLLVLSPSRAGAQSGPPPSTPPPGDDPTMAQARQHFEAGRNAYNAGDFVAAIREFKAAEQLRPSPILAYNIGLANEKLGKRRVAVRYYRRYLEQQPNAANRAEVEGRISTLESEIASQPPPGGAPPGATAPPAETSSDMPPTNPNTATGQQAGYDPYAGGAPGQAQVKPHKKSYWWVWLIVAGGVTLTIIIVVAAVLATSTVTTVYGARGDGAAERTPRNDIGVTLFRF